MTTRARANESYRRKVSKCDYSPEPSASGTTFFLDPGPCTAAFAGPQLAVGFCWYRTDFVLLSIACSIKGLYVKSTTISLQYATLYQRSSMVKAQRSITHGSTGVASNRLAGLPSLTFFIITGLPSIHLSIMAWITLRGASVLIDPAEAWERETR